MIQIYATEYLQGRGLAAETLRHPTDLRLQHRFLLSMAFARLLYRLPLLFPTLDNGFDVGGKLISTNEVVPTSSFSTLNDVVVRTSEPLLHLSMTTEGGPGAGAVVEDRELGFGERLTSAGVDDD